ncbi:hypothetical protein G9A89_017764 [Geosiphon pyriformis]|nr:hypothetical protein G9A89_017764 [Geosiphon pyriformis]
MGLVGKDYHHANRYKFKYNDVQNAKRSINLANKHADNRDTSCWHIDDVRGSNTFGILYYKSDLFRKKKGRMNEWQRCNKNEFIRTGE